MSTRTKSPIAKLEVQHFKAFASFEVEFGPEAYLVGPNSSGKSTLIAGIRTAARLLDVARRTDPTMTWHGEEGRHPAWPFSSKQSGLVEENVPHEFFEIAATMKVEFRSGYSIYARWPSAADPDFDNGPSFALFEDGGASPRTALEVTRGFPEISVVPVLAPLEQSEILQDARSRGQRSRSSRVASRFFRNDLYEYETDSRFAFDEFAKRWLGELELEPVLLNLRQGGYLDLFYKERTSPREKELFWAGDGIQIFVQLLWHLHRAWGASTVVLDEPEVFLHADLQRRLVKILSEMPAQTIVATHSSEIISEAPASSIIWVSKERRRAVPAPDPSVLEELSTSLGSGFNLRLARALRAKVAVFVEGEDMKILRVLAATVGATAVATEAGVVVESFGGYTKRASARAFAWLTDNLLGKAVHCFVVLDSDYRPPEVMQAAKKELEAVGAVPKAWKRKELESYLLVPSAIGRLAGASEAEVRQILDDLAQELRVKVVTRFQREFEDARHPRSLKDRHQVLEDAMTATEAVWGSFESRIARCPAKDLIRGLNRELASRGFKTMSTEDIAMELSAAEIPDEMRLFLLHVEHTARATDGEDE